MPLLPSRLNNFAIIAFPNRPTPSRACSVDARRYPHLQRRGTIEFASNWSRIPEHGGLHDTADPSRSPPHQRADGAVLPPDHPGGGRDSGTAQVTRQQSPDHRRRRSGQSGGDLPRRGRHRHARQRRRRPRRSGQPAPARERLSPAPRPPHGRIRPPPPGTVPSCAEGGIVGALAGHMGTLQAIEAIKILLDTGETLANRLLIYDALIGEVRTLRWKRNPDCPMCGDHPTITALIDYEAFCGVPGREPSHPPAVVTPAATPVVSVAEAKEMLDRGQARLIDVREVWEWVTARIPGAILIPMGEIPQRMSEIPKDHPVIIHCATGQRSAAVTDALRRAGYERVFNLAGGIVAWMNEQLPVDAGAPEKQ